MRGTRRLPAQLTKELQQHSPQRSRTWDARTYPSFHEPLSRRTLNSGRGHSVGGKARREVPTATDLTLHIGQKRQLLSHPIRCALTSGLRPRRTKWWCGGRHAAGSPLNCVRGHSRPCSPGWRVGELLHHRLMHLMSNRRTSCRPTNGSGLLGGDLPVNRGCVPLSQRSSRREPRRSSRWDSLGSPAVSLGCATS